MLSSSHNFARLKLLRTLLGAGYVNGRSSQAGKKTRVLSVGVLERLQSIILSAEPVVRLSPPSSLAAAYQTMMEEVRMDSMMQGVEVHHRGLWRVELLHQPQEVPLLPAALESWKLKWTPQCQQSLTELHQHDSTEAQIRQNKH